MNALCQTNTIYQSRANILVSLRAQSTRSQRGQPCRDTCPSLSQPAARGSKWV